MNELSPGLKFLEKNWKKLKRLHPISIDLTKITLIREQSIEFLSNPDNLKSLILELGLTDDSAEEFPPSVYPYCGQGLDRKSTRLNSSHRNTSRMPSSA